MTIYLSICIAIIAATRFFAYWGINILKSGRITLIKDILYLTYVENTGAAFGIFKNSTVWLSVLGALFFVIITYVIASKKLKDKYYLITLGLLAGGGISNVCDRIKFGFVVDYIDFSCINYPVFNLADICVVVGCILLFIKIIFTKENK